MSELSAGQGETHFETVSLETVAELYLGACKRIVDLESGLASRITNEPGTSWEWREDGTLHIMLAPDERAGQGETAEQDAELTGDDLLWDRARGAAALTARGEDVNIWREHYGRDVERLLVRAQEAERALAFAKWIAGWNADDLRGMSWNRVRFEARAVLGGGDGQQAS